MTADPATEIRRRPFPWRCPNCGNLTLVPATADHTAKVRHDGAVHELLLPALELPRCTTCGETVVTAEADERINEALRAHLRLLTPEQIRSGVKALGLQQQELAERLGVAPETISRWVTGAVIQSRAMDNLLRIYFQFPDVRRALAGPAQNPSLGAEVIV